MSINTQRKNIILNKLCINENISKWIEQDIIVPDTKPDALKIVNVSVNPYLTDFEIMDSKIKVMGKINYFVIYKANDEKFATRGLNVSYPFTEILDLKGINKNSIISIRPVVRNIIHTLPNERKIAIKSEVVFKVRCKNQKNVSLIIDFDNDALVEKKISRGNFSNIIDNKKSIIASREELMLPKDVEDVFEILNMTSSIRNTEFKESYNKIMLKGDIVLSVLYLSENDPSAINKFSITLPFSAMVDFENIKDISKFDIEYIIKDINLNLNPDATSRLMNVDYQIEADVTMFEDEEEEYVEDFYSQTQNLEFKEERVELVRQNKSFAKVIDIKENITNILPPNTKIIDYYLDTNYVMPKITNNSVTLEGNAKIILMLQNTETLELDSKVIEILINETFEIDNLNSDSSVYVDIINEEASVTQNGTDIEAKITLEVVNHIEEVANINMIEQIEESPINLGSLDSINIYIVKPGDTLWSIAKKYKTSVDKIVRINDIADPDVISVGQKILIIR